MGTTSSGSDLTMAKESEPSLNVRLVTDDHGHPTFLPGETRRHYKLVFEIENAPLDTYAATFELDPSSFYDPVRTLEPDSAGKFRLETTAYGDFPLVVRLHRAKAPDVILKEGVARALKQARATMPANSNIDDALSYIADH